MHHRLSPQVFNTFGSVSNFRIESGSYYWYVHLANTAEILFRCLSKKWGSVHNWPQSALIVATANFNHGSNFEVALVSGVEGERSLTDVEHLSSVADNLLIY